MIRKDRGSILRLSPLGENGVIVTWCTEAHGILRTAAKDARKPGSDMAGRVDLFHDCELVFAQTSKGDLHTLRSISLINPRLPLRSSLSRLRLASYMSRLLISTVELGDTDPAWYTLIHGALDYICHHEPSIAILRHFEKRLATLHGLFSPTIAPLNALLRHFQHLPAGRDELAASLQGKHF